MTRVVGLHARGLHELLDAPTGWRGSPAQRTVVADATRPDPDERYPDVPTVVAAWCATIR